MILNEVMLCNVLSYLPVKELQSFGMGQLLYLLKSVYREKKNEDISEDNISLKRLVNSAVYKKVLEESLDSIVSVTARASYSVVLTDQGKLYVCGKNNYGQLGLGDNVNRNNLEEIPTDNIEGKLVRVILGDYHTTVLTDTGKVYVCGHNMNGQLGLGDNIDRNILIEIDLRNIEVKVVSVTAGYSHMSVLTDKGKIYICGGNSAGQLGLGDFNNRNRLEEMNLRNVEGKVDRVIRGGNNTAFLTEEGKVYVCGWNGCWQLGIRDNANRNRLVEMPLRGVKGKVVSVTLGGGNTAVLTDEGKVYVCGNNCFGQLGLGYFNNRNRLEEMNLRNVEGKVLSVLLGWNHTALLIDKGKVYVCGRNLEGQLGLGDEQGRNILEEMPSGNIEGKVVSVTLGGAHTAVLTDKRKVYVCGKNDSGQLGLGDNRNRNRLVEMPTRIISRAKDAVDHAYKVNSFIRRLNSKFAIRKIIKNIKEAVLKRRLAVDNQLNNPLKAQVVTRAMISWNSKCKMVRKLKQLESSQLLSNSMSLRKLVERHDNAVKVYKENKIRKA